MGWGRSFELVGKGGFWMDIIAARAAVAGRLGPVSHVIGEVSFNAI